MVSTDQTMDLAAGDSMNHHQVGCGLQQHVALKPEVRQWQMLSLQKFMSVSLKHRA